MNAEEVVTQFDTFGQQLSRAVREHPLLAPFFTHDYSGKNKEELTAAYAAYLKITAGYVTHTVPLLRAAGHALASLDEEDQRWSEALLRNAYEETDPDKKRGHHIWALDDLRDIGAPDSFIHAPAHPVVHGRYRTFMVEEAGDHPYGILGAKGVLEHLSISMADDFAAGVIKAGIATEEKGTYFLGQHGILDLVHTRTGNDRVKTITDPRKLDQIAEGAWVTREAYYSFLDALPSVVAEYFRHCSL